jgi:protein-L-isoaspartate(D-aspartate) O-methyltransferase
MDDPAARRAAMVDRLRRSRVVRTERVERALRAVPRHVFLADMPLKVAYADHAVPVKRSGGSAISSASQPTMVALMLEDLEVTDGHRVLEVGTGTGYNAALLALLVGPTGRVVSVELEEDLARSAEHHLEEAGAVGVEVVSGDGALGHPPGAPYDRVIVTAGAPFVQAEWADQLVEGGRLVVPIVDEHGVGSVVVFDKVGGHLRRGRETPCGFVLLRRQES